MWNINLSKVLEYLSYDKMNPLLFNSSLFFILFLLIYSIYPLVKNSVRNRTIYLLLFSLFFYYKCSGIYFLLLLLSTVVDFYLGILIHKEQVKVKKRAWLILSMIANLGLLAYFKYTNFLVDIFNNLSGASISNFTDIFLPVGISFYTFQTMSYSIDVYRGNLEPEKNILNFAFYVSFFPQLVAGPIVRASDFIPQIRKKIDVTKADVGRALALISGGLFKKAVISDYISINFVDRVFSEPDLYTGTENLLAVMGYTLQIFCDFSGYSDMAIGIALLLGFSLPDNFNLPYRSTSITEFWRRWHISLSTWLKDYLYISLGGNRKGKIRTYINLLITMLLGGLWHGANWKFMLWGGLHGFALGLDKVKLEFLKVKENFFTNALGWLVTFTFVSFCWIFFRADSFASAFVVINKISEGLNWNILTQFVVSYNKVFALMVIGFLIHFMPQKVNEVFKISLQKMPTIGQIAFLSGIIWLVIQAKSSEIQPFIYFQF